MGPVTERSQRLTTTSDRRPAPAKGRRRNETGDEGEDSLRRCISTGESLAPERLIRFVIGPDDGLVPDLGRELPGRGVWLKANREAVEDAVRRKLFGRAFARAGGPANPSVPEGLADLLENLLASRAAHWLGLTRRAGGATAGFEKVREAISKGEISVLIQASDGGADGLRKLRWIKPDIQLVETLTCAELSLALGRENVVHAALQPGRLAARFLGEARRLAGFRVNMGGSAVGAADLNARSATTETDAACVDASANKRAAPHAGQGRTDE